MSKKTTDRYTLGMVVAQVNGEQRVVLMAADDITAARLKRKGYRPGDIVGAELKKPRDGRNWRRIHKLGQLLIENVEAFALFTDAHKVIKRLQIESGIGCEQTSIQVPNLGMVLHNTPLSLAFDELDDGEFEEIHQALQQYIINTYWHGLTHAQMDEMAGLVGRAA